MNEADINKYRTLLLGKLDEITGKPSRREELRIVQSNEQIEILQLAGQREFAARTLERESKNLTQIRAALKRIDAGEFGICIECEDPVSHKRLAAVPWAACCLRCQETRDTQEATESFLKLAA